MCCACARVCVACVYVPVCLRAGGPGCMGAWVRGACVVIQSVPSAGGGGGAPFLGASTVEY